MPRPRSNCWSCLHATADIPNGGNKCGLDDQPVEVNDGCKAWTALTFIYDREHHPEMTAHDKAHAIHLKLTTFKEARYE